MIFDKLLSFHPASGSTTADIDLGHEGALLMGNEYVFLLKRIGTVSAAGTWALTTSDDNFTTSKTLASGAVAAGAAGAELVSMVLPFKPLAKLRLTFDGTNATYTNCAAVLIPGPNHVEEMKNAKAA